MKLKVDKRFVKAGDIIEVTWDAEEASSPRIVMHMGLRESTLSVPQSGSKRFRLKQANGKHWIGLKVWDGNKETTITHRIFVYGKTQESDSFEYIDKGSTWWRRTGDKIKRWWASYTPDKKRLYILLLLLIAYQGLFSFGYFYLCNLFLTGIIFWLFWQITKRN